MTDDVPTHWIRRWPTWFAITGIVAGLVLAMTLLTRGHRIALHNVGTIPIEEVWLYGPGVSREVGRIEPGSHRAYVLVDHGEGSVEVEFTVDGQRRRATAIGYVTGGSWDSVDLELGPEVGAPVE